MLALTKPTESIITQPAAMPTPPHFKGATVTLAKPTQQTFKKVQSALKLHAVSNASHFVANVSKVHSYAQELFAAQTPFNEGLLKDSLLVRCFTSKDSATVYVNYSPADAKQNENEKQSEKKLEKEGSTKQFSKALRLDFTSTQSPEVEIVACLQPKPGAKDHAEAIARMHNEINLLLQLRGKEHICHLYNGQVYEGKTKNDEKSTEKRAVQYQRLYDFDIDEMLGKYQLNEQPLLNNFIEHILKALIDLDEQGILHLDLKFKNIFFSIIKQAFYLSDFDLSAVKSKKPSDATGTPAFLSPELFAKWCGQTFNIDAPNPGTISPKDSYDAKTDMWSLGIMLKHLTDPSLNPPCLTKLLDEYHAAYTMTMKDFGTATETEREAIMAAEDQIPEIIKKYQTELNRIHQEPTPQDPLKHLIWGLYRPLQKERWTAAQALEFFNKFIKAAPNAIAKPVTSEAGLPPVTPLKAAASYFMRATLTTPLIRSTATHRIHPRLLLQTPGPTPNAAGGLAPRGKVGPILLNFDSPS